MPSLGFDIWALELESGCIKKHVIIFRYVKKFPGLHVPSDALSSGELKHIK